MTSTTTEEGTQDAGVEQTQPVEGTQDAAETTQPNEESVTDNQADDGPQDDNPEFDATALLQSKGIDPTDPDAINKLAKMYDESQKRMHEATAEKSGLKKQLDEQPAKTVSEDPLVQQLYEKQVKLERDITVSNFRREVNLSSAQEDKMSAYIAEHPEKGQLVNLGYMTLQELYTLSGAGQVDPEALKEQGRHEGIRQVANQQRGMAITGAARQPVNAQVEDDPILAALKAD